MKRCGRGGGGSRRRDVTGRESLLWCENTCVKVLLKLKWGPKSQQEEEEEVPNGDEVEEEDDLMICNWTLVPTHQRVTLHAPTGSSLC